MSALDTASNLGVFDTLKTELNKVVWELYEKIKGDTLPIHITIFHIPINIDVPISNLSGIIEKLVGPEVISDTGTDSIQTPSAS